MTFHLTETGDLALMRYLIHGKPVDAGLLRYDLGLDTESFPQALQRLIKRGCNIEQINSTSCRLVTSNLHLWQDYLDYALPLEGVRTLQIRVFQETTSTQDVARTFAPNQALVIADQQTAGRGRLGRQWASAPGASVLMSFCWATQGDSITHDRVSMLAGLAVAKAAERLVPAAAIRLKWPNDVVIDGKKLAGILIDAVNGAFIIGIGLNATREAASNPALTDTSTSLDAHASTADRLYVIEHIAIELDKALRYADHNLMLDEWRARAALGQTQTFEHNGQQISGTVMDLDPDHGLIVRRDTGEIVTLPAATTSVVK